MQVSITLSNKEKRHYFIYLLGMLLLAVSVISYIVLSKAGNPFSEADMHSVMILQDKTKFNEAAKSVHKQMDSTFVKINKMDPEKATPVEKNNIEVGITNINRTFEGTTSTDPRKSSYQQIAKFYEMYYQDKKSIVTTKENLQQFDKQLQDCMIRFNDKKQQMNQR
ncbi:Uncharacterised protein [Chryseobacterium taklimakanense]|uniref:Type VI secretion system transmembrane protein TssO n=1 Tax=Chryseobacterium taklimakanense TaxID=536441 RepID=A0A239WJZ6_9FLAO|nr:type VI secretion system TssO [Chryseobacterium taklimakanense]SNV34732.1 Uncharacterised protein [Chryseobacterium taklimakanense]